MIAKGTTYDSMGFILHWLGHLGIRILNLDHTEDDFACVVRFACVQEYFDKNISQCFSELSPYHSVGQMETVPRYWPFVRGIYQSPVDFTQKGRWRGTLMFSLMCAWTNGWASNRDAGDFRRHSGHYNVTVMKLFESFVQLQELRVSLSPEETRLVTRSIEN